MIKIDPVELKNMISIANDRIKILENIIDTSDEESEFLEIDVRIAIRDAMTPLRIALRSIS